MRTIPLIQFGLGGVGRAVVTRVLAAQEAFAQRYSLRLAYIALCDSGGAAIDPAGFTADVLQRALNAKTAGIPLSEIEIGYHQQDLAEIVDVAGGANALVIDVTASDETVAALMLALERGYSAVLANKKPLTGSYETFQKLTASERLRYEATVGAGVPVIAVLRQALLAGHDEVRRIEGSFSGTLGTLASGLQAGEDFSVLVAQARQMGYTEPDPRDDLGGMDVARKTLILARTLGWRLELSDIRVEPLFPPALSTGSVADFMAALADLDDDYRQRQAAAASEGKTLRYVAGLAEGEASVGLQAVPLDSPLGRLQGADNLVAFHSDVYHTTPLVLQGRGAGVHGTAAGVLADIIALTR